MSDPKGDAPAAGANSESAKPTSDSPQSRAASSGAPPGPTSKADRLARLRAERTNGKPPEKKAEEAKADAPKENSSPDAGETNKDAPSTSPDGPQEPAAADKPKESNLEAATRLARATRQVEIDRQKVDDERRKLEAERGEIEDLKPFRPAREAFKAGKRTEAFEMLFGEHALDVARKYLEKHAVDTSAPLTESTFQERLEAKLAEARAKWQEEEKTTREQEQQRAAQEKQERRAQFARDCGAMAGKDAKRWPTIARHGRIFGDKVLEVAFQISEAKYKELGKPYLPTHEETLDAYESWIRGTQDESPKPKDTTGNPNEDVPGSTVDPSWKRGSLPPQDSVGKDMKEKKTLRMSKLRELRQR